MNLTADHLFKSLWEQYIQLNPTAEKVHQLLKNKDNVVSNDHVAFRTFKHPDFGIHHLAKSFIELGYEDKGDYHFKIKKLDAKHFEHPNKDLPKIFISELIVDQFSPFLQETFQTLAESIPPEVKNSDAVSFSGCHWERKFSTYETLYQESPYGAWLYAFGFCANHFTVNFNALKGYENLQALNNQLKENGFTINSSGGEIKGSPEVYLEQSSTMANEIHLDFSDGTHKVPSCYYEFARRYPLPHGELYQGFVTNSADKIFESTDKAK